MLQEQEQRSLITIYPQLEGKRIYVFETYPYYYNIAKLLKFQRAVPASPDHTDWYGVNNSLITLTDLLKNGQYNGLIMHPKLTRNRADDIAAVYNNGFPLVLIRGECVTEIEPILFDELHALGIPVIDKRFGTPELFPDIVRTLALRFDNKESSA
jgi:hypothetical protein